MQIIPSYVLTASRFMTCRMTWYSSQMPLPPSMSRATRAMSNAFPQEFRLIIEIISDVALARNTITCGITNYLWQTEELC